jgi:hypothetical protein
MPLYALGPLEGLRVRRLIGRIERYTPPAAAPHWQPAGSREPQDDVAQPIAADQAADVASVTA